MTAVSPEYCIIETGTSPESLVPAYGTFPDMAQALLQPHLPRATFRTVSVVAGEELPPPAAFAGYIIMGSEHSVCDRFDWILRLESFIRDAARGRVPMVGICFGHQVMASALGGKVQETGWIVGGADYTFAGSATVARSIVFHQDQVTIIPPDAEIVLSANDSPNAGLRYVNFPGWSVQSHPEFTPAYMHELIEYCRGDPLTDALADAAKASLAAPLEQDRIVEALAGTLNRPAV